MTPEQFKRVMEFEKSLTPGLPVHVRWTNCGHCYGGPAEVLRVNAKSIRVRLTQAVPAAFGPPYPIGREIVVPAMRDFIRWSCNNCVVPVYGY